MDESPELNARVMALARELFAEEPRLTKLHSENNYVCRMDFPSGLPPMVLKLAGNRFVYPAVRQEALALRRLREAGIAVPLITHDGTDDSTEPPYFVMAAVPGTDLASAILQRLPWAADGCRSAGAFVRKLHALPLEVLDGMTPQHYGSPERMSWRHRMFQEAWDAADEPLREALSIVLDRLNAQLRDPRPVVTHESFVANHVLMDGEGAFAVNDWETIRAGHAERDLACFLAALKTWLSSPPECRGSFIEGYTGGPPLEPDVQRATGDWEITYLMNWTAFSIRQGRAEIAAQMLDLTREAAFAATRTGACSAAGTTRT